ncbi:MAG: phosphatase PAP2 family protein [Deltaproteobacteria bacterium]
MIKLTRDKRRNRTLIFLLFVLIFTGCTNLGLKSKPASVPEVRPGILAPYLPVPSIPNSMTLLPPPPAAGSAAAQLDEDIRRKYEAQRGSARWNLAAQDAELDFPLAAGTFTCAMNIRISEQDTPYLYRILRRSFTDAIISTLKAKNHYKRIRPFAAHNTSTCSPGWEKDLKNDGSYPSGHSAIGWTWALILSEIDPEHGDAILARGRAFGESRLACNVHWSSDVVEGRFMASAVVARLHTSPDFLADLKAAKAEVAAVRGKGPGPTRNCAEEAAALSPGPVSAPSEPPLKK